MKYEVIWGFRGLQKEAIKGDILILNNDKLITEDGKIICWIDSDKEKYNCKLIEE